MTHASPRHSEYVGFPFPSDLDLAAFEAAGRQAALLADPNDVARLEKKTAFSGFASGWHGVIVRYRAASEAHAEFISTFAQISPTFEIMYKRERNLFECVCALLSSFECVYYAAYCVSTEVLGSPLLIQKASDLRVYAPNVVRAFRNWIPNAEITNSLARFCEASEYTRLKDLRNFVSHKGIPPQLVRASTLMQPPQYRQIPNNLQDLAADYSFGVEVAPDMFDTYFAWARGAINECALQLGKYLEVQAAK